MGSTIVKNKLFFDQKRQTVIVFEMFVNVVVNTVPKEGLWPLDKTCVADQQTKIVHKGIANSTYNAQYGELTWEVHCYDSTWQSQKRGQLRSICNPLLWKIRDKMQDALGAGQQTKYYPQGTCVVYKINIQEDITCLFDQHISKNNKTTQIVQSSLQKT